MTPIPMTLIDALLVLNRVGLRPEQTVAEMQTLTLAAPPRDRKLVPFALAMVFAAPTMFPADLSEDDLTSVVYICPLGGAENADPAAAVARIMDAMRQPGGDDDWDPFADYAEEGAGAKRRGRGKISPRRAH